MTDPDLDFLQPYLPGNPTEDSNPAFDAQLLQRVRHHRKIRRITRNTGASALCLILALGLHLAKSPPTRFQPGTQRRQAAQSGVDWLLQTQERDGSWNVANLGGHRSFRVGTTALALSALLHSPEGISPDRLERSAAYLQMAMQEESAQAVQSPLLYNDLLALNSLLELQSRYPHPERETFLKQRLQKILALQQRDGGWGYDNRSSYNYGPAGTSQSNAAVTWWVCHLLESARFLPEASTQQPALKAGRAWLARCFPKDGPVRYNPDGPASNQQEALFWMAQLESSNPRPDGTGLTQSIPDAYRDWLRSRVQTDGEFYRNLLALQEKDGSWRTEGDRWSRAGGRVYSTAARVISLSPPG